ncbi:hypothetical protein ID866_7137 [Astraeus odoratus]|nr:hypothetical protein ID866_7137 [Astraeus odoratus]
MDFMGLFALEEMAKHAERYSISLNGRLDRDTSRRPQRGGFADVYPGTLRPEGVKVAIKTVRSDPPNEVDTIAEVLREVHLWSKLRHDNIIPLLGITTDFEHTVSIIAPWVSNGNARKYVESGDHDPRPLLLGIARGLHYLHTLTPHPVYHGDLKGLNILVSDDGHALISDFGLSHLVQSSFSFLISDPTGGTINWVAPENLSEYNITAKGDVWAFGMTALELFTRTTPFHEVPTTRGLVERIRQGPPERPDLSETYFRLTDPWWVICRLCWERDPSTRPEMEEILKKIEAISDEMEDCTDLAGWNRATESKASMISGGYIPYTY